MAITQKQAEKQTKKGSTIIIPDAKLMVVSTNKETGKTQFGFAVAEGDEVFYVTGRLVRRNADKTGFNVFLPQSENGYKLFKSHKNENGEWIKEELVAEKVEDLGYPIEG